MSKHLPATASKEVVLNAVGGAQPLPTTNAPVVPDEGSLVDPGRHLAPLNEQITHALKASTELQATTTYEKHLGETVVPPATLGNALAFAARWSLARQLAEEWHAYTKGQETLAWAFALQQIAKVTKPVVGAAERSESFGAAFPSLLAIVSARSVLSKRAAGARVRKNKGATKTTPTTAASTPAPSTNSTAPAAGGHG